MLYDLTSSYVEGRCCPLAKHGCSRDGKLGKLQIELGLLSNRRCNPRHSVPRFKVHAIGERVAFDERDQVLDPSPDHRILDLQEIAAVVGRA